MFIEGKTYLFKQKSYINSNQIISIRDCSEDYFEPSKDTRYCVTTTGNQSYYITEEAFYKLLGGRVNDS